MSIFKKSRPSKVVDDTESIVYDFNRIIPFWSYRAVKYYEYIPFVNFGITIDIFLKKLLADDWDSGNSNMLDNLIFDMARQAENDLNSQHTEHRDIIKSFSIRFLSDKKSFEHERLLLLAETTRNEQQQQGIEARFEQDKFLGGKKHV